MLNYFQLLLCFVVLGALCVGTPLVGLLCVQFVSQALGRVLGQMGRFVSRTWRPARAVAGANVRAPTRRFVMQPRGLLPCFLLAAALLVTVGSKGCRGAGVCECCGMRFCGSSNFTRDFLSRHEAYR